MENNSLGFVIVENLLEYVVIPVDKIITELSLYNDDSELHL